MMSTTVAPERSPEQKLYDEEVLARVKAGMALLEEKLGPEWVDHIDMKTLDLSNGNFCVLGQIYGEREPTNGVWDPCGFERGVEDLDISEKTVDYGFFAAKCELDTWDPEFSVEWHRRWIALQACWEDQLTPKVSHNE
jgi:hypothetical protein